MGEAKVVHRVFSGTLGKYFFVITILMSLFHLYYNTIGVMPDLRRNAFHMLFVLAIGYLMYPLSPKKADKTLRLDFVLSVLGIVASLYLVLFENALHARNEVPILSDLIFAALAIVLVLELTRRAAGWLIPTLSILALSYALFLGKWIGGGFHFRGVTISRILYRMYFAPDGLFGSITTISSTFVFLFILFAAFLLNSGAGEFLMDLSTALLGKRKGGPAKISVFASGLMGSISGSAVANTVGTGSMTIPLMKRIGLPAHIAGGVEAAASTGGQIMPPIMGAGAFIMAQWTQIPYYTIVIVSFVPAVMYFLSVAFFVHVKAYEYDLPIMEDKDIPKIWDVIKNGYHFTIPLFVLVGLLLSGYTPTFAASAGILSILLASYLNKRSRMGLKKILDSLSLGAKNSISTAIILICAGIVVGVVNLTGVGITFSMMIMELSHGYLLLAIALVAFASLILGMGLPVTASYIMLAVLAAPALQYLGVPLLAAHMIIFWYSQDANVTPPVCLAAYAASGIAGSKPMKTGFAAWSLAKGLYIIPLLFAYSKLLTGTAWEVLYAGVVGLFGLFAYTLAFEGYFYTKLSILERIVWGILTVALLYPNHEYQDIAIGITIVLYLYNKIPQIKRERA
ncbi:MAG TPA: TRAP transporter permease, partial [Caldithrix abyssi]|nr:TRAP transporter permease [Caldithrix abyssi]